MVRQRALVRSRSFSLPEVHTRRGRFPASARAVWIASVVALTSVLPAVIARADAGTPVVVIMMENHSFGTDDFGVKGISTKYIVGNPDAPYINNVLIPSGTLFTNYYATAHPSLPNYLEITAGQTAGCTSDSCLPDSISVDNLFSQMGQAGLSFDSFAQSMPSSCGTSVVKPYDPDHNPEVYYSDVDPGTGFPYACTNTDLPLPGSWPDPLLQFSFVVPDKCRDMHGVGSHISAATVPSIRPALSLFSPTGRSWRPEKRPEITRRATSRWPGTTPTERLTEHSARSSLTSAVATRAPAWPSSPTARSWLWDSPALSSAPSQEWKSVLTLPWPDTTLMGARTRRSAPEERFSPTSVTPRALMAHSTWLSSPMGESWWRELPGPWGAVTSP